MERLLDVFGEVGGEFLFDAHFLLGKAALPNHGKASAHFEQALINSSWHEGPSFLPRDSCSIG